MPIIHGKQINFGEVTLFTPYEIMNSWHSCDGEIYKQQGCQYCYLHGKFRCNECNWSRCTCEFPCEYSDDWEMVIGNKRTDSQYESLLKNLDKDGFVIPLNVIWRDNLSPKHGDGNHRFSAALELGFSVIPYIVTEGFYSSRRGSDGWSVPEKELEVPIFVETPTPDYLNYMKEALV